MQGFQPVFAHAFPRQHNGFARISEYHRQSTLTAKQAEIQFKRKFVKKITNSTNRGRNQVFVQILASCAGIFDRLEPTCLALRE